MRFDIEIGQSVDSFAERICFFTGERAAPTWPAVRLFRASGPDPVSLHHAPLFMILIKQEVYTHNLTCAVP